MQILVNLYMKWILNFEDQNELVLNWNMHTLIHREKKKSKFTHQKKVYKKQQTSKKYANFWKISSKGFAANIKIIEACLDTTL